jgi:beta-N-acetylhexosaminidase
VKRKAPPRLGILSVALILLSSACLFIAASAPPRRDFWAPGDAAAQAESLLASMSDEEVLGQLFMMAYPGDTPPELLYQWIEKRGLGGVKIFGWNAEDTGKLAASIAGLQKASLSSGASIPLLVATDQEGGWIRHVKGDTSVTPGNMAIGASGRPYDAYWSAYYIGRELDALGINMNFAPAVDLATKPKSTIIGPRAFSSDPAEVAALGAAYCRGLADSGVIATAKHFPGHGDTELDSHGVLPVIRIDSKTLWDRELLPFRLLVSEGVPAVMSGHLNFPWITGDGKPASLSKAFMTDLLRGRMGFEGLAVTDDLLMSGAANGADLSVACREAIEAGNDMLMASRIIGLEDAAWKNMLAAYRSDPAFRARAREAALRVLKLKLAWLKPKGKTAVLPAEKELGSRLPDKAGQSFFAEQAFRAATALSPSLLPWKPKGRLLAAGPNQAFLQAAQAAYPEASTYRYATRSLSWASGTEQGAFESAAKAADSILICVADNAGMDLAMRALASGKSVAILSLLSPEPLARLGRQSESVAAVAVYGNSRQCMDAGLAVLRGIEPAEGRLPLVLEP